MRFSRTAALALACILPFAAGCKGAAPHVAPQPTGAIQGVISFTGPVPRPAAINAALSPACARLAHRRQYQLEDHMLPRTLPPVFLWISSGLSGRTFPAPHEQAVLTQLNCRFHPQLLGVMPGQPIDFTNSDPFPAHLRITPRIPANPSLDLSLRPQSPGDVRSFPRSELMIPVTSPGHPWMHAYINVVPNPCFTVSGPQGRFVLRNLPPGTYSLSAIQPGYPVQTQPVTVQPNAVAHVNFNFSSTASPAHNYK